MSCDQLRRRYETDARITVQTVQSEDHRTPRLDFDQLVGVPYGTHRISDHRYRWRWQYRSNNDADDATRPVCRYLIDIGYVDIDFSHDVV